MAKGGKREGAGRPKKADEQKANYIMRTALRELYNREDDQEAQVAFVLSLLESQRGQIFVAEHIFGKAPDKTDITTNGESVKFSVKDLVRFKD